MHKRVWVPVMILGLLALFLLNTFWTPRFFGYFPPPHDGPRLEEFTREQLQDISNMLALNVKVRSIIGLVNTALLLYLLILHISVYRTTKSNFSLSLILFSFTLILYTITNNPVLIWMTGFQRGSITQIFNFIPDLFTTVASIIFIYISRQ